jgi:alanine-synthesizing transaminase
VALKYKNKYNVDLDPETEVIATIGSKEGFSHLCLALLGPGDTVVVPDPAFPHSHLCRRHGRRECDPRSAGQ